MEHRYITVPLASYVPLAGKWKLADDGETLTGIEAQVRGGEAVAVVEVPAHAVTVPATGAKSVVNLVRFNHSVSGDPLEDFRVEVWSKSLGYESPPSTAVLVGHLDAQYDARGDTAAERGAVGDHDLTASLSPPAAYGLTSGLQVRIVAKGAGKSTVRVHMVQVGVPVI